MLKKKLSLMISLALLGAVGTAPLLAQAAEEKEQESQESSDQAEPKKDKTERITITGSFIPRETFDGPSPMTIIDEEEMKEKGLLTIADVVETLTENSGYTEGDAGNLLSGFTVGASEANFRGLGAGRTLVLVNGRRIADYPIPFGGEQNGVDMGSIPTNALSRVEYLSSGASAIYGSDAVGGVINIITKRDMEQTIVSGNFGTYADGYGGNGHLSYITGHAFDKGSITFSLEHRQSESIDASEVEFMQDRRFLTTAISMTRVDQQNTAGELVSPEGYDCEANGYVTPESTPDDGHKACNYDVSSSIALMPESKQTSIFVDGRYDLNDEVTAFATLMGTKRNITSYNPSLHWSGYAYGEEYDRLFAISRSFDGDLGFSTQTYEQEMLSLSVGLEGSLDLGDTPWYWDLSFSTTTYGFEQNVEALREERTIDWIFNGGEYTELDTDLYAISNELFENDMVDNVFRDAGPDRSYLVGRANTQAKSEASSLFFKVAGELSDFDLFYNPVEMAVIFDVSTASTSISPDERTLDTEGHGWANLGSIQAEGTRNRMAVGAEFLVPVTEDLEVTLASRFDRYDDDSSVGGRNTSQVKFSYQMTDAIKLRGGWGQTFRAPDMFNIYGESSAFGGVIDLSSPGCFDGETFSEDGCPVYSVRSTRSSSQDLKEESGEEKALGLVFSPTHNIGLSIDWYNIRLEDMVNTASSYDLMVAEWQCANGELSPASRYCQDVAQSVIRDAGGSVQEVIIKPQNQAFVDIEGVDFRAYGQWESEKYGRFGFNFNHSVTLGYDWLKFEGDEVIDLRGGQTGLSTPVTNSNLQLFYSDALTGFKSWSTSLFIMRQGETKNYANTKDLDPYYMANWSASYKANERWSFAVGINNLFNAKPRHDETNPRWPYYWAHLQSPMGRYVGMQFSYLVL